MGLVRVEARGRAHRAIHIGDGAAGAAHNVMVIVASARLIQRGGTGGLDAAGESRTGQRAEHVVDGLGGHRVEVGAGLAGDLFDLQVAALSKDVEHGKPRLCYAQTMQAQKLDGAGLNRHLTISAGILDWFKKSAKCVLHDTNADEAGSLT